MRRIGSLNRLAFFQLARDSVRNTEDPTLKAYIILVVIRRPQDAVFGWYSGGTGAITGWYTLCCLIARVLSVLSCRAAA